jgi:hypothetical protein
MTRTGTGSNFQAQSPKEMVAFYLTPALSRWERGTVSQVPKSPGAIEDSND